MDSQFAGLRRSGYSLQFGRTGQFPASAGIPGGYAADLGNAMGAVCPNFQKEPMGCREQKAGADDDAGYAGFECMLCIRSEERRVGKEC